MKVALGARSNSPSPIGGEPGRGTAKAPATFILRGGTGTMAVSRDAISQAALPSSRLKPLPRTPFIVRGDWCAAMAVSRWTVSLCGLGPAEASTSSLDRLAAAGAMIEASKAIGPHSGRY